MIFFLCNFIISNITAINLTGTNFNTTKLNTIKPVFAITFSFAITTNPNLFLPGSYYRLSTFWST